MDPVVRIAQAVKKIRSEIPWLTTAIVTSVSPLQVGGAEADVTLKALGWYEPAVGDPVLVIGAGNFAYILGTSTPNQATIPTQSGTVTAFTTDATTLTASVAGVSSSARSPIAWMRTAQCPTMPPAFTPFGIRSTASRYSP